MNRGAIIFGVFVILAVIMLIIYFFVPLNTFEFTPAQFSGNSNFSINGDSNMQFYTNMRYSENEISYKIDSRCSLQKKNEMEEAFNIVSNLTILEFYPVLYGEEISVTCSEENIVHGDTFIGGEGGVTNVTVIDNFHIIFNGKILLIRDSECPTPNIAIHELLHALGFIHSANPNNIMYETYDCDQTIGDEIPLFLNKIYAIPSNPDLSFDNSSAVMNGKYLDANISIRNNGFKDAPASTLIVSVNGKEIKEISISPMEVGYGRKISLSNLWISQTNVEEIEFYISSGFEEISKDNNIYVLYVKK